MNQKLYSTFRLMLGLLITIGITQTGSALTNHYRQTLKTVTAHYIAARQEKPQAMQLIISYCSQFIESTKNHLG